MQHDFINRVDLLSLQEGLEHRAEAKSVPQMNEHNWFGETVT